MQKSFLLRLADSADGYTPPDAPPLPPPPENIPPPPAPAPPAATVVLEGVKTEADVAPELDAKKLQTRIAQLEDERRALLAEQRTPRERAPRTEAEKKSWLNGGSFFD